MCESSLDLSPALSILLWYITKAFASLIWVYGCMYILWPRKLTFSTTQQDLVSSQSSDDGNELVTEDDNENEMNNSSRYSGGLKSVRSNSPK